MTDQNNTLEYKYEQLENRNKQLEEQMQDMMCQMKEFMERTRSNQLTSFSLMDINIMSTNGIECKPVQTITSNYVKSNRVTEQNQ